MTYQASYLFIYLFILGFACLRNPVRGSRYVQTIVKVFMEEARDTDIQTMLTHVRVFAAELCYILAFHTGIMACYWITGG